MTTLSDLIGYVEHLTGHSLNNEEWLFNGDRNRPVGGVTVSWMASPDAIRAAGEAGHHLLIGHESLFFPYNAPQAPNLPQGWETWRTNRRRKEYLEAYGIAFLRLHSSVDEICIFDDFADLLELGEPVVAEGFVKVFEIPPTSLSDLVNHVKTCMAMLAVVVNSRLRVWMFRQLPAPTQLLSAAPHNWAQATCAGAVRGVRQAVP